MAYLGKSKTDRTKRISPIKEAADLFEMEEGDYIYFHAVEGKIIINKATEKFNGFDIEGEEIERRIREKEEEIRGMRNMKDMRTAARKMSMRNSEKKRKSNINYTKVVRSPLKIDYFISVLRRTLRVSSGERGRQTGSEKSHQKLHLFI